MLSFVAFTFGLQNPNPKEGATVSYISGTLPQPYTANPRPRGTGRVLIGAGFRDDWTLEVLVDLSSMAPVLTPDTLKPNL